MEDPQDAKAQDEQDITLTLGGLQDTCASDKRMVKEKYELPKENIEDVPIILDGLVPSKTSYITVISNVADPISQI